MYAYIEGEVVEKNPQSLVLDNNGIGYFINISTFVEEQIQLGEKIKIYTYYHVSEDNQQLFGFLSIEDKRMFEKLISISKIGPKTAIGIMSKISSTDFALAVISNDLKVLGKLPGVGSKTAQRIVLELKDKISTEEAIEYGIKKNPKLQENDELIEALLILGYSKMQVERVINDIDRDLKIEDQIKNALNILAKR